MLFSKTVLNADNEITRNMQNLVRGSLNWFSRKIIPQNGAFLAEDGFVNLVKNREVTRIMHKDQIRLPGIHNVENYLAAISATAGEVSLKTVVKLPKPLGELSIELSSCGCSMV